MEFLLLLYALSSVILWFKALLGAEFSNWILLEFGDSLEVFNEDKYEGQFEKILEIAPSLYVFWSLTAIVTLAFTSKTDDFLLMSSGRKCSSYTEKNFENQTYFKFFWKSKKTSQQKI